MAAAHGLPTDHPSLSIAAQLRAVCGALREAVGAHHQYEHLKARGVPHDRALRQAFGVVAHSPKQ